MKLFKAIIIIFFLVAVQTSFVRLANFMPLAPNLPLIGAFLLSYQLPFADIMILALIGGIFIDVFSAVSFGVSSLALILIFGANFLLREGIFRIKTRGEFVLSSFLAFFCFYPLVLILNYFFNPAAKSGFMFIPLLLSTEAIGEILLNFILGVTFYYLIFIRSKR